MDAQRKQTLIVIFVILGLVAALGVAYQIGQSQGAGSASAYSKPVKKFRARPGTERENARALYSSVPSAPEETTDRQVDVWGSLDSDDKAPPAKRGLTATFTNGISPEESVEQIKVRMAELPESASDSLRAQLEAAMAFLLLQTEDPDTEAAERAFARAGELAATPDGRVNVARFQAKALLLSEDYDDVLEVTAPERFIGAELGAARLEVELIRGMAMEELDRQEEAERVYRSIFETAMDGDLAASWEARGVVRQSALRLGRMYRAAGEETKAVGVSRRLRAWLGEEDLVIR